jgi:hypothetical protein
MSDSVIFYFSLSILLPAIAAALRFRNSHRNYRPFLIYIFISLLNELLVGLYLVNFPRNIKTLNWQIFNLVEWIILLIQFYYWGRFKNYKPLFYILLFSSFVGWVFENFIYSDIYAFNPVFLIFYSFVLVLLSINTINYTFAQHNQMLNKNGLFIICAAMIIFFIYTIVVFTFLAMDTKYDKELIQRIFNIRVYINALTNILYAIGIYYIPVRGVHDAFFDKESKRNILQ